MSTNSKKAFRIISQNSIASLKRVSSKQEYVSKPKFNYLKHRKNAFSQHVKDPIIPFQEVTPLLLAKGEKYQRSNSNTSGSNQQIVYPKTQRFMIDHIKQRIEPSYDKTLQKPDTISIFRRKSKCQSIKLPQCLPPINKDNHKNGRNIPWVIKLKKKNQQQPIHLQQYKQNIRNKFQNNQQNYSTIDQRNQSTFLEDQSLENLLRIMA